MNFKHFGVVCAVVLLFIAAASANDREKKGGKGKWKGRMQNMTCKGEVINMKEMRKGKRECMKEILPKETTTTATVTAETDDNNDGVAVESDGDDNPKSKGKKKRGGKGKWNKANREKMAKYKTCINVCTWKKQGLLKDDGTYSESGAEKFIKSVYPNSVQADLKKEFDSCASTHGGEFSMDNDCEGYKKFQKCSMDKYMDICGIKEQMQEMKKKRKNKKKETKGGDAENAESDPNTVSAETE